MGAQFQIDLEKYSLTKFKRSLKTRHVVPSRKILQDDLDSRFAVLEGMGIASLKALIDALKTKPKIEAFAQASGLPTEYLTLLGREARSYLSKPLRLDKLPGLDAKHLGRLAEAGLQNSKQFFLQAQGMDQRKELAEETGLAIEELNEIFALCDLSRIYGVGPVFARMIYDLGVRSAGDFLRHSAADFVRMYEEQTQKKADFSLAEIQFSLDLAKELDLVVKL